VPQPAFPRDEQAMQWYMDYGARHAEDGEAGRLVSCFRFAEDWAGWEMHPAGAEVVVCIEGSMTLIQEVDGEEVRTTLSPANTRSTRPACGTPPTSTGRRTGFFVTTGFGTQGRPR
jgi:hypothetical protein